MQKKVLLVFDDPGGGLAVSSLMSTLRNDTRLDCIIYSGKLSTKFLEEMKLSYSEIDSQIDKPKAEDIISKEKPDIIVTGTSGGNAEQEIRNVAFEREIKSVVVLDFWKDYKRRWLYASYPLEEMKDDICVMDELTKEEMIEENFPQNRLFVTGQPYLDLIFNGETERSEMVNEGKNNYLFLSQPLEIIGIKEYEIHPVRMLLEALRKVISEKNEACTFEIRLHPSEELSQDLMETVERFNSENLEVKIADERKSLKELISNAHCVIGYNTIAMFESRAMGRRTISLKVVPVKNSLTRAMKSADIEIVNCNPEDIYKFLKSNEATLTKSIIAEKFQGGVQNCVNIILRELNLN